MSCQKICLMSIIASHYRQRVYYEMQRQMGCGFIFGDDDSGIKRMDVSILRSPIIIRNHYVAGTHWYYQRNLCSLTKGYDVLINDLGIFCLSAWMLMILSKFRRQRIYHWDHGWYGRETMLKKIIKRLYFGLADGSFIYGDRAIELMRNNGFNTQKLYPIHNSLDYERQLEIRSKIRNSNIYIDHFGNDHPVLIMIGRLNFRKKLSQLIEAIKLLKDREEIYNVVFVGDGEDRKTLEEMVSQCKLTAQIWFYGPCYDEKLNAQLLYNADLCVVPGDIGLTAIHSMMFGVPVLTHDYFPNQGPEFEAIKPGITGSYFKYNDVRSLSDAITEWFCTHKREREQIRKSCFDEIDVNWTPQYQIDVMRSVIDHESNKCNVNE